MNGHTPGPWALDESRHEGSINRMEPFRHIGMVSLFQHDHTSKAENLANALLISAAPELLAALEECVRIHGTDRDGWPIQTGYIGAARAAIAKAKGIADATP